MTDAQEVPADGQPAAEADRPTSQFEIGDVAVLLNEEVVNDRGNHCELAIIIGDKRYVDGTWQYTGVRDDGDGNGFVQQASEGMLKKPRFAIGQRVGGLTPIPGSNNVGTVMGYWVDVRNALGYDVQRDMSFHTAGQLLLYDE